MSVDELVLTGFDEVGRVVRRKPMRPASSDEGGVVDQYVGVVGHLVPAAWRDGAPPDPVRPPRHDADSERPFATCPVQSTT